MFPGEGAIEYARTLTEGLAHEEAAVVFRDLFTKPCDDPRIKWCAYCGFPYRDKTRPNNSKTCSQYCKTDWDTYRRAKKKRSESKPTPRDYGKPEGYQFWRPEYPFWLDQRKAENYWQRNEVPYDIDAIDAVVTRRQIYGEGNRRRVTSETEY